MRRAEHLLKLQRTDLALDAARKRIREINAQLVESEALRAARQAEQNLHTQLDRLRIRSKDMELQSAALDDKIESVEKRLYSGSVKNPKELGDLQRDATSLRRHKSELDDALLNLMIEIEQTEQAHQNARADLRRVETGWQSDQSTLLSERAGLQEQTASLDARRAEQRAAIRPEDLGVYEQLRARRHGTAVAQLDDGVCSACGVQPSDSKLIHLQRDDALLTCGNCERILVAA